LTARAVTIGVHFSTAVILSAAKDLHRAQPEILRCAQDDSWRGEGDRWQGELLGVALSTGTPVLLG